MAWVRALLLTAVGLGLLVWLVPTAPLTGDGQHYIAFARNNLQQGASPWHERRLLAPLVVRFLPLDPLDGFHLLTIVALGVTTLLTWLAARPLVDEQRALLAIPLVFGTWVVAPNLREFGLVDPLAWTFVAAIWLATIREAWLAAAILGMLGVLAKEVVVLAALAAAAAAWSARQPLRSIGVAAPALATAGLLTSLVPGSSGAFTAYVTSWITNGLGSLGPGRAVYLIFAAYGALWLLLPRGYMALPNQLRRAVGVFVAAAMVLPLIGSPERMEEAIFPAVIAAALVAMRGWRLEAAWLFATCGVVFAARVGGDAPLPTAVAWTALLIGCGLAGWAYRRPRPALRAADSVA